MNLTPKQTIKGTVTETQGLNGSLKDIPSVKGTVAETQSLRGSMKDIPSLDNTLTKEGYAADAKAVGEALDSKAPISHTEDKGNPHGVTASQVGARPDTWMPSASEIGARPDNWMPTASDVGARANTWTPTAQEVGARPDNWMPTAEQVGARPNTWTPTAEDVGARPNTWMPTAEDVGARPSTWMPTAEQVGARPNTWTPNYVDVGAAPAIEDATYEGCYYRMVGVEKEWINPPMVLGEEYRTTERYNGSPVYTKVLDFGNLPNATTKSINCGVHASNMLSMTLRAVGGAEMFNEIGGAAYVGTIFMWESTICIRSTNDKSNFHGYITTKYTK